MRRSLIGAVATMAMVATMVLPAGAAELTANPGGAAGHGGGGYSHRGGEGGGRRGDWHGDSRHDRDGDGHNGRTYYYGPYYDGSGPCPDGGYYDANGTYWYWDPYADDYAACPGS